MNPSMRSSTIFGAGAENQHLKPERASTALFDFIKLPGEIRNEIYAYIPQYKPEKKKYLCRLWARKLFCLDFDHAVPLYVESEWRFEHAILRTNHLVYREASSKIYKIISTTNGLKLPLEPLLQHPWLISDTPFRYLTNLRIDIGDIRSWDMKPRPFPLQTYERLVQIIEKSSLGYTQNGVLTFESRTEFINSEKDVHRFEQRSKDLHRVGCRSSLRTVLNIPAIHDLRLYPTHTLQKLLGQGLEQRGRGWTSLLLPLSAAFMEEYKHYDYWSDLTNRRARSRVREE
ncbi:hypothetical protein EJ08DRAFT_429353 [Tothia fuscella]|uniref:F-box domain-containing protein n=1 Tax=Tothia fuscella TaxID=1048955 RepID=A0A9P4P0M8_9PEZI|nr:hypothetical protein EJ08DRAFT_429353 [Tothia fuscella]